MEHLTSQQLLAMLERGELSAAVYQRRHTLLAIAALASRSKGHTPQTRARLKFFKSMLAGMEGNDEVEVTGETFCEVVMHAMSGLAEDRGER